ncbi:MAG TPA: NAD(P)/FAD-dependent oxidoreductase [Acidimicrobiia bacterium]|nr:NAD(P)/FAD-dependent oxidoreductase [Acidimicrobiia bacterium]
MSDGPLRVVVVGSGFAGLNAVKTLNRAPVEITIVDRRNFHLFQPLLYQVATAALNPSDIAYPVRSVFRAQENVRGVLLAEVTGLDLDGRKVTLEDGSKLAYDYLILATGATHSYFGHDAWEPLAPGLKTLEDALVMRQRILAAFEQAERNPDDAERLLTFVVVGAGPTGVELAGALVEIAVHSLGDDFDVIDPTRARVLLVEGAPEVLPVYPNDLSRSARRQLETLGVEVITGAMVAEIDREGVTLTDGARIDAGLVLWAAGVQASPLGGMLGVDTDRTGRVPVEADLSLPGHPEVFVTGDLATVPGVPGVAPAAMQMGRHAARMIQADITGRARTAFDYKDKGSLATIGRARAVADFGRIRFGGFVAWLAWLAIHIFYLIGFRNRVLVLISWAWSYLTFRRGARIITGVPALPEKGES